MADNVTLDAGSGGATVAGASLSFSGDTAVFQIIAGTILSGSEGSWSQTLIVGGAGAVTAGVQRVTLASDDPAVVDLAAIEVLLGTIDADTGSMLTALQLIDDAVYTDGTGTPSKGLAIMGTDGTNPQLVSVDSSGNVQVDLVTANVTNAGTFAVQVDGSALTALQAIETAVEGTLTVGSHAVTNAGTFAVQVDAALPAGTNAIGKLAANSGVDIGDVDVLSTVSPTPKTSGGLGQPFRSIDLDETEEQVKATAGQVYRIFVTNSNASVRYLKVYNATAANVTVGSTAPVATFLIPPSNSGATFHFPEGWEFDTAITVAATTGVADSDTGAPGANEVIVHVWYE